MHLREESFGPVVNTRLFFPLGEGRKWFSETEFCQCHFLSCPCPRAVLWAWGCPGQRVSPQLCLRLCCSLKAPSSTGTIEAMGAVGIRRHCLMGCGKQYTPRLFQCPGCSLNRKGNKFCPWSSSWPTGEKAGPLVLLFVNYLCCGSSRRPRPPSGPSIAAVFAPSHSVDALRWQGSNCASSPAASGCQHTLHPCKGFPVWGVCRRT